MAAPTDISFNTHDLLEHDPLYILLDRDFRRMERVLSWRRRNRRGTRRQSGLNRGARN